jgi:hypothetical protein
LATLVGTLRVDMHSRAMPRFFFHLADGRHYLDEEGSVHDGVESARREAVQAARGMMADDLMRGAPLELDDRIEIADEDGGLCAVVTFREAAGLG